MARHAEPLADICLVLEGTYPYVSGGVSTWVHQVISMFPEWKFALFFLGAQKDPKAKPKYHIPPNVVALEEVYLFDGKDEGSLIPGGVSRWQSFFETARKLGLQNAASEDHDFELVSSLMKHIEDHPRVSFESFWTSRECWAVVRELYERNAADESFLDFFWALRYLIQPMWKLARSMNRLPAAKLYHTACTGYAGVAAALASARNGKPMVLTEHGIYLRERIADICRSPWIPQQPMRFPHADDPLGSLRRMWIGFFDQIGRMAYHHSTDIVSLFGKNAKAQEHFGAHPERITLIPNGIPTENFEPLVHQRAERRAAQPGSKVVGFLGRVVSIKDVKTLIRAARKVVDELPDAVFLIAGPTVEEPEYHRECIALVEQLGVAAQVRFLGPVKMMEFLPLLDVMILTSISEGLPFVVIESLAAGVPVVSTDVGACSEILHGRRDEEPALGTAGLIADVGASDELSRHCIQLLTEPQTLDAMTLVGLQRAERYYHEREIQAAYRSLYARHIEAATSPSA
jgi:polysaccharide biosynthesis protein PelF